MIDKVNQKPKTVLITGGAGYIGSHCALYMDQAGWDVVVLDDLSLGHREAVKGIELVVGDYGDADKLDTIFSNKKIDTVMHFAAHSKVGESIENPGMYYRDNVGKGLTLMDSMQKHGVNDLVFSSTAAVYGEPVSVPMDEESPKDPINPYGASKLMFEMIALDLARSAGLRPVFLRYFNAAGADPEGRAGEDHNPETHLIPLVIDAALGRRESITIYGSDYPTKDGTCVRDYIHIYDLADAHIKAANYLANGGAPNYFNLGNGEGYSVREVIKAVRDVSGRDFKVVEGKRRAGDPAELVASAGKAKDILEWRPAYHTLDKIVKTAWDWAVDHPDGYNGGLAE